MSEPAPEADGARRAWDAARRGAPTEAARFAAAAAHAAAHAARRERQRVEVVKLAIAGEVTRACGLASEHLSEFPDDALVAEVRAALGAAAKRRRGA